jgi:uncharacterized protein (TIGR00725 family)
LTLSSHTIGVLGSGSDEHSELATAVGRLLAELGVNLLTGGGGGVMSSVARAYTEAARSSGISIGIIPCASIDQRSTPKRGYPNRYVELPIYTHLPYSGALGADDLSRNHINVLSCTALIALPGGDGTASEIALAVAYGRPVIAYSSDPALIASFPQTIPHASSTEEVATFLRKHLSLHDR